MARRDIDRLQGEIEELFADLWQVPRFAGLRHGFRPTVDCFHDDEPHELTVVVELAGRRSRQRSRSPSTSARSRIAGQRSGRASRARCTSRWRSSTGRSSASIQLTEDVDVAGDGATTTAGS